MTSKKCNWKKNTHKKSIISFDSDKRSSKENQLKTSKNTAYAVKNTNISKQSQKQNSGSKIKKIHTTRKEKIHIFVKKL